MHPIKKTRGALLDAHNRFRPPGNVPQAMEVRAVGELPVEEQPGASALVVRQAGDGEHHTEGVALDAVRVLDLARQAGATKLILAADPLPVKPLSKEIMGE